VRKWVHEVLEKVRPSDGASNGSGVGGSGLRSRVVSPGPKIAGFWVCVFLRAKSGLQIGNNDSGCSGKL